MNTIETLTHLRTTALNKKQTLKSLRAEFIVLLENDKELAALETSFEWCSIGGNSVEQARKTKGFDMFALHIGKLIDILEPFEMDFDEILGEPEPRKETIDAINSELMFYTHDAFIDIKGYGRCSLVGMTKLSVGGFKVFLKTLNPRASKDQITREVPPNTLFELIESND